jgi:ATP-dependent Lhr-like helicase
VVLVGGRLALYVERGGRGLVVVEPELLEPGIEALGSLVRDRRVKRLAVERVDGEPVTGTEVERLLVAHGFLQAPRRVVLRA